MIFLTGDAGESLLQRAQETHPFGYLLPPFEERQLRLNLQNALAMHEREKKHRETEMRLERNITELQDQAQLLKVVFNSLSDGMVVTGTDGNFLFVNPTAESIVGMGATDSPADQWSETYGAFYPDKKTPFPSEELPLMRAMRGEVVDDVALFIRNQARPEGVYISVNARPLQENSDKVKGGVITFRNITELKETEAKLQETIGALQSQTRLMETVFNSISDGVVAADENGNYLVFNDSAQRIVGPQLPETTFEQRPEIYGLFFPDKETFFPENELPLTRAIRGEATIGVDMFIRNQNNPRGTYVSVSGNPLSDDSGMAKGGVIIFRDVTELKEAEIQVQQSAARLQTQAQLMETTFNSISDGVVVADENGKLTIFNPSATRIAGIGITESEPAQWTGQYGIFFADQTTPFLEQELPLLRAIRGEASDEVDMFIRNPSVPDGVYLSVSGRPLRDESGLTTGGVIVFRDVTERMRAEEALTQAFAQGRLEIVDTVLHNIGNAINSVTIGVGTIQEQLARNKLVIRLSALARAVEAHRDDWIPYLQSDPQGQKVMPFILALAQDFARQNEQLIQTVERVRDRVDYIVDIVQTQKSPESETIVRKEADLRKLINDAVKMLQELVSRGNIRIHIDCQNAPKVIRVHESKFHQMLVNLIKNSIEAIDDLARSGGLEAPPCIRIRSYVRQEFLVLDVIDNGIGIAEKHSRIIFNAGYTTKETGTGLGLHSAANFVVGSGGKIHPLSSGAGQGTTMRVLLRLSSLGLQNPGR